MSYIDWWFAVVGHLESCDENVNHCGCQYSGENITGLDIHFFSFSFCLLLFLMFHISLSLLTDMLVVEFKQHNQQSRFRKTVLNRNVYEEQKGLRFCWFGGIRKLDKEEEIQRWNSLSLPLN